MEIIHIHEVWEYLPVICFRSSIYTNMIPLCGRPVHVFGELTFSLLIAAAYSGLKVLSYFQFAHTKTSSCQ